jgi:nitrite reductase/ring-hydroxylating ferredoxin subunit
MHSLHSESRVETSRPVWLDDADMPTHPPLEASRKVDVCVVGAGIAGLSVAYQLLKQGRGVLIVDQFGLGAGQSGQTSAHLASGCDDGFARLEQTFGTDNATNGHRLATYRDDNGTLHQCNAMCTHLKALVRWNPMEKSWDCPAHGSRFDCAGKPLQGPAVDPLAPPEDDAH